MNQVKHIKTQLKIAKKMTPWAKIQRAKQIPDYDWKFNQSEEDLTKMASVLYQAVVLAKQGQKLSLVLPYCNISKIDLDLLQFSGTTNARQARDRKVARINSQIPFTFETLDQGLDWILEYCTKTFKSFTRENSDLQGHLQGK